MDDMISRQAAIDALFELYEYQRDIDPTEAADLVRQGMYLAEKKIEQLPSAQPEQTDCEYCHEDSDGYVKPIEKNCHAFIHFGMNGWELSMKANGWHGSAKIRYCPMCGRDLLVK